MCKKLQKKIEILVGLIIILAALTSCGARVKTVVFSENLDKTAVTIDGNKHALSELAFYVSYEESIVQQQAIAYNSDNPIEYWNVHVNGNFIKLRAKEEAMNMAIHDMIFYGMAESEGIELSGDETDLALNTASDYWADLSDYAKEGLGITENEMTESLYKMAIAQKYQVIYAEIAGLSSDEFDVGKPEYEQILNNHKVKINGAVWDGIKFGEITIDQSKAKRDNYEYFK